MKWGAPRSPSTASSPSNHSKKPVPETLSKIEVGRYSALLRRALGMKGQQTVASELSPEISATWQLESDAPEWQVHKGVRLVSAAGKLGGVAAEFPRYLLVNPAGSGMIATVQRITMSVLAASEWTIRLTQIAFLNAALILEAGPRDPRWFIGTATTVSPIVLSGENNAASITGGFEVHNSRIQGNLPNDFTVPIVLTPNSTLFWSVNNTNSPTNSSVHWSERPLPVLEQGG